MNAPSATVTDMGFKRAQSEVDRLQRGGSMNLLCLAAFWGIAAALYTWGSPLAGQIALLVGTVAAYPVAWAVLKLAGGPALIPRTNPLMPLSFQVAAIPLVVTVGALGLAQSRPDAFFATAMLGLSAAALPQMTLYGRRSYLWLTLIFLILPVLAWFAAVPLLPWFGLIGVVVLLVSGALLLRGIDGFSGAAGAAGASAGGAAAGATGAAIEGGDSGMLDGGPRPSPSPSEAEEASPGLEPSEDDGDLSYLDPPSAPSTAPAHPGTDDVPPAPGEAEPTDPREPRA